MVIVHSCLRSFSQFAAQRLRYIKVKFIILVNLHHVVIFVLHLNRVTMILLGLKDPFSPFENITCTVVFGGTVDALRSALERSRSRSAEISGTSTTSTTPLPMGTAVLSGPSTAHVTTVGGPGSGPSVVSSTGIPSSPGVNGQVGGKDVAGTRQTSDKKRD